MAREDSERQLASEVGLLRLHAQPAVGRRANRRPRSARRRGLENAAAQQRELLLREPSHVLGRRAARLGDVEQRHDDPKEYVDAVAVVDVGRNPRDGTHARRVARVLGGTSRAVTEAHDQQLHVFQRSNESVKVDRVRPGARLPTATRGAPHKRVRVARARVGARDARIGVGEADGAFVRLDPRDLLRSQALLDPLELLRELDPLGEQERRRRDGDVREEIAARESRRRLGSEGSRELEQLLGARPVFLALERVQGQDFAPPFG